MMTMNDELWRRREVPPEPWTHEDNPDWIFIEGPDPFFMVPVKPMKRFGKYDIYLREPSNE